MSQRGRAEKERNCWKQMERSKWIGTLKKTGRWETRNAKKCRDKKEKKKEMKGLKGDEKTKKWMEALQGLKGC